jgi:hypothetical protein
MEIELIECTQQPILVHSSSGSDDENFELTFKSPAPAVTAIAPDDNECARAWWQLCADGIAIDGVVVNPICTALEAPNPEEALAAVERMGPGYDVAGSYLFDALEWYCETGMAAKAAVLLKVWPGLRYATSNATRRIARLMHAVLITGDSSAVSDVLLHLLGYCIPLNHDSTTGDVVIGVHMAAIQYITDSTNAITMQTHGTVRFLCEHIAQLDIPGEQLCRDVLLLVSRGLFGEYAAALSVHAGVRTLATGGDAESCMVRLSLQICTMRGTSVESVRGLRVRVFWALVNAISGDTNTTRAWTGVYTTKVQTYCASLTSLECADLLNMPEDEWRLRAPYMPQPPVCHMLASGDAWWVNALLGGQSLQASVLRHIGCIGCERLAMVSQWPNNSILQLGTNALRPWLRATYDFNSNRMGNDVPGMCKLVTAALNLMPDSARDVWLADVFDGLIYMVLPATHFVETTATALMQIGGVHLPLQRRLTVLRTAVAEIANPMLVRWLLWIVVPPAEHAAITPGIWSALISVESIMVEALCPTGRWSPAHTPWISTAAIENISNVAQTLPFNQPVHDAIQYRLSLHTNT